MTKQLALFCLIHPADTKKKDRVLNLLASAREYYTNPTSKCTTWDYMLPSNTLNFPPPSIAPKDELNTLIAGMEIYSDKSALSIQTESAMFKDFHETVKVEELYARDEELTVWYPVAGFVSRGELAGPFGNGVMVLTAVNTCKEGRRDAFVDVMRKYAEWVRDNEPGFLTYSIMVRPKAPDDVLVYERCTGVEAFKSHVGTTEMAQAWKAVRPYIKSRVGQEWTELDNAFVGNVVGGSETPGQSKL